VQGDYNGREKSSGKSDAKVVNTGCSDAKVITDVTSSTGPQGGLCTSFRQPLF